jgi:nicotinamidase/pyrazinamidase
MRSALLIVDLQNDFCPGGALPTPHGNNVVSVINKLIDKFSLVIASRDWHPEKSNHFKIWPAHCIRNTPGANFPDKLNTNKLDEIFIKGTEAIDDGYSAFEATNKNLAEYLKENRVNKLYVTGLTAEYCVKFTVLDAIKKGFKTYVIKDAVEGIRLNEGDFEKAFEDMKEAGAVVLSSKQLTI